MAKKRSETGAQRQKRIGREQHRPEQNAGYDEAVRNGGPPLPDDAQTASYLPPEDPDERRTRELADIDEREAKAAAADVRRQDRSAD
jgi:hypothetical protein